MMRVLAAIIAPFVLLALPSPNEQVPESLYGEDTMFTVSVPYQACSGYVYDDVTKKNVPVFTTRHADTKRMPPAMLALSGYGDSLHEQMRRALSERALQFAGPIYETAVLAKCEPTSLPVLRPGTPRIPFKVWKARYGVWRGRNSEIIVRSSFDGLVNAWSKEMGIAPRFPSGSEDACRFNDAVGRSYSLYPLGIVIRNEEDREEEVGHYVNFGVGTDTNQMESFSVEFRYVTGWEEFKAAAHEIKIAAWRQGYDLGVSGQFADFNANGSLVGVSEHAMMLMSAYAEQGDDSEHVLFRSWCENDSIWRMIL